MFGDFDWLLNASHGLSVISEFLVKILSPSDSAVIVWSLKITPHLKHVATLLCETLVFKLDRISTLINTVADRPSWAYKQDYWDLQISEAIWLYTLWYHINIIFDRFCCLFRKLCLPWHSMDYSLPPVWKCSNVRDLLALTSIHFITKSGAASQPEKAQDERFDAASNWCVSWSETERYWRWH